MRLLIIGCLLLGLTVFALAIDKAELDKRIRTLSDSRFDFGGEDGGIVGGGNACGSKEQNEQHTAKHGFLSAPLIGQKQPLSEAAASELRLCAKIQPSHAGEESAEAFTRRLLGGKFSYQLVFSQHFSTGYLRGVALRKAIADSNGSFATMLAKPCHQEWGFWTVGRPA